MTCEGSWGTGRDLADSCHVQAHAAVRAGLWQGCRSDLPSVQGCCLLRAKPSGEVRRLLLGHGPRRLRRPGLVKGIRRAQLLLWQALPLGISSSCQELVRHAVNSRRLVHHGVPHLFLADLLA